MRENKASSLILWVVAFAFLFAGVYIAWQATHGGVESHRLLDKRSMPAFSNWWGLAIVPLIGWLASWSVQQRSDANAATLKKAAFAAVAALLAGVALSIAFLIDGTGNAPLYVFLAVVASGFFLPTYRAEYYFGFIIGMSVAFGLVLPAIISLVPM
jgi:hypothetical protein